MITSFLGRLTASFGWATFTITFEPDDDIPGQSFDDLKMMLKIGYSQHDIDVMYTNFKKLDVYHKNTVLFASFLQINRIDNPLSELIFRKILAMGIKEEIDFQNYVVCIWNGFSISDDSSIAELVFELFDTDNSGEIPVRSFFLFLRLLPWSFDDLHL
jgi:Ca2+-binding EF-hand superfamily protein